MIEGIFSKHDLSHLKMGLEVSWRERMESSNNLVNAETPDFEAKDTDFRSILMSGADQAQRGEAYRMYLESLQLENEFNLESEMKRMSQASLESQAYGRVLSKRYSDLRNVMREGR